MVTYSKQLTFLKEKVEQAPNFFSAAPIVIDVSQVGNEIDFALLKKPSP